MSTRAMLVFCEGGQPQAMIYRHDAGQPDGPHGVPADLTRFFRECETFCTMISGPRFGDPDYLAAKWVVWEAHQIHLVWAKHGRAIHPLDFLSLGVDMNLHWDLDFGYLVHCDRRDDCGRPTIEVVNGALCSADPELQILADAAIAAARCEPLQNSWDWPTDATHAQAAA